MPGVLFWAAEPTLETRQASGDGRGDADYSQSSRDFVAKKLQHLPTNPASYENFPVIRATFKFNEVVILR